jgi:prepilin-type processing-associated H-X9-DG protein
LNSWRFRLKRRVFREESAVFLNLGCGAKYLEGFINVDGNLFCKKDMWLDLRNHLPFDNESVDGIYCSHVLEHFYPTELRGVLQECHRVLKQGGGIRILVPSLEKAIEAYSAGKASWFPDFPASHDSIGGRFVNYLFCDGQHRLAFDWGFADEVLRASGFDTSSLEIPVRSKVIPRTLLIEAEDPAEAWITSSLIVEAHKKEQG